MIWQDFKAAVNALLLTDAVRLGTTAGKEVKIRCGAMKLQESISKYRTGHQDIYVDDGTINSSLTADGFASTGELPERCEPRDCYVVRKKTITVSAVDATSDTLTSTAHGIPIATSLAEIFNGQLANTGGSLPGGLASNHTYWIRVVDGNTLSLHTTATGALNNTGVVDITSAGTGTTTMDYAVARFLCRQIDWKYRYDLTHGGNCLANGEAAIALDPNGSAFLISPVLPVGLDADGFLWSFELNWDGVKLEWADADETPFDEQAAEAVAEYVTEWFKRHVDQDLKQAQAAEAMFRSKRTDLYLTNRRATYLKR